MLPARSASAAPTGAPTVGDVSTAHPRLMADESRFADLKRQTSADSTSELLLSKVIQRADAQLALATVRFPTKTPVALQDTSRAVQDRVYNLMLAWRLTSKSSYIEKAWAELQAAANFPNWNPDHFLDTAEMTNAFAIAYDWGYSYWSSSRRNTIRTAILSLGLTPSRAVYAAGPNSAGPYKTLGNWSSRADNINVIVNSAMIVGALAIAGDTTSPVVDEVLGNAHSSLAIGLTSYRDDGSFDEGPTYWEYATRFAVTGIRSLQTSTGSDFGLLAGATGLAQTAGFMMSLSGTDDIVFGFADSELRPDPDAAYAGLGAILNDGSLMALAAQSPPTAWAALQLLWRDPTISAQSPRMPPRDASYAAGIVSMRASESDPLGTYVGFRSASNPLGHHQHIDGGDFNLQALGQEWAIDLGNEDATYDSMNEDRQTKRWQYYRTSPEGHNTLLLDAFRPEVATTEATTLISRGANLDSAFAISDLTAQFSSVANQWKRGVKLFDSRNQVLVQDEISVSQPVPALWSMHTSAEIVLDTDGRTATLFQNGQRLAARIISAGDARFQVMDAVPLPTSPIPAQEANDGVRKLAIEFTARGTTTLAVQFTPLPKGSTDAGAAVSAMPLSTWSAAPSSKLTALKVDGVTVGGFSADTPWYQVVHRDQSNFPSVSASASAGSSVSVVQATGTTRAARVTVQQPGLSPTTYSVIFANDAVTIAGVITTGGDSGWSSATYDRKPESYWGTSTAGGWARWELSEPISAKSMKITWTANAEKLTKYKIESSNDKTAWTLRFNGEYRGPSGSQIVKLSNAAAAKFLRLTILDSGKINEVEIYRYDAAAELPDAPARALKSIEVSGLPSSMPVGATGTATRVLKWNVPTDDSEAEIRFMSSDPAVASVDATGKVRALKGGVVRIGALATADGIAVSSSVSVTVVDSTRVRIYADADSYVQSTTPDTNFGTQMGLLSKPSWNSGPDRITYLGFNLSSLAGKTVTSAVLSTENMITDGALDTARVDAHSVAGSWSESAVTYTNKPALGATVGSFLTDRTRKYTSADITDYVASLAANRTSRLSLGLTQDNVGANNVMVYVSSRDYNKPPYIDITLSPSPAAELPARLIHSVSLSDVPSSIEIGESATSVTSVKDSIGGAFTRATVAYSSTQPGVATVTPSGVINAVAPGSTSIVVTATADGIAVSSSVSVTVVDSTRVRIYADADSYVQSTTPDTNFGTQMGLLSKPSWNSGPDRITYLGFNLSSLAGKTVTSAVLSTENMITDGALDTARVDAHSVAGSWSESAVTYTNKPALGATVGSFLTDRTRKYTSADITDYVASLAANRTSRLSLGLTQDNVGANNVMVYVSSRDYNKPPYIDITLSPSPAAELPARLIHSVSLSDVPSSIEIGESATSVTSVKDSIGGAFTRATVAYSSTQPGVATVTPSGVINAVAPGSTSIVVTATADGIAVSSSVSVTVVDSTRVRIYADADSYVQSTTPDTNFGTQMGLLSKPSWNSGPDRITYLGFNLSSLAGKTVTSAVLSTENMITDGALDTARVDAHSVAGSWSESAVTYTNKPALGATVGSFLTDRTRKYTSADITDYVASLAANRTSRLSLGLTQDNVGANNVMVYVSSRDYNKPPYIDITLEQ
ncbi:Ig-like domain (group 2) [Microbacterium pygmaeum]|uniref:Ig-like domain (Group 2) n=1 Tax=Microbacterium pygmaeum TaxID=370764 RepID=A0A1G8DYQ6_9MICO|nr:Ig-like domain (group 2) [Microbacterium pygmaeum]